MSALSIIRTRAGAGAVAVSLLVASMLGIAAVAAQAGPVQDCSGDTVVSFGTEYFGLADFGNRLLSTAPNARQFELPSPLPAGEYELDAVAYDGYPQRETISPQPEEQWYAEYLAADGSVLATSGTTVDVADSVEEASWFGSLGTVTLAAEATHVRVVHAAPGSISVNSIRPVCLGATPVNQGPEVSQIIVDYDSTASATSSTGITCEERRESATGDTIDISLGDLDPSTACTVAYNELFDCTVIVDPVAAAGASSPGSQVIVIPEEGGANVTVDIDCADRAVTATTAAPTVTTPPTTVAPVVTTTTIATQVEGTTETNSNSSTSGTSTSNNSAPAAQPAQAQDGQPAFTG